VQSRFGFFVVVMATLMLATSTGAVAQSSTGPIVVITVQGDVDVTSGGVAQAVSPGSTIATPATIRTGDDGFIELRQGATTAAIASNTRFELPATTAMDGLIEHIRQPTGNVLYDVAKRPARKLRIETPYLVAVVKGTRFNVAAQAGSATVSLLEGRLEVWTPDDSDVVQLNAGEIAMRSRGDPSIQVIGMATGESIRARNATRGVNAGSQHESSTPSSSRDVVAAGDVAGPRRPPVDPSVGDSAVLTDAAATSGSAEGRVTQLESDTVAKPDNVTSKLSLDAPLAPGDDTPALGVDARLGSTPVRVDAGIDLGVNTTAPAVVEEVVAPLPEVVEDVTAPVATVVEKVAEPIPPVIDEVAPLPEVVEDITAPVATVVEEVAAPIPVVIEEVAEPLPTVTEQVIAPLLRGLPDR
jgi:hypothetical protein